MRRTKAILLFILVASFTLKSQQPNFILVFCDDLNFLESPVMQQAITPNLDLLKSQGISFTNAHSNAPICGPSRASVFSGILPHNSGYYGHQMGDNDFDLNPGFQNINTLFEHFKNNGYAVYGTGKIFHKGASVEEDFTEYLNLPANHGPWPWNGIDVTESGAERSPHPNMPNGLNGTGDGIAPLSDIPSYPLYTGWRQSNSPFNYQNDSVRDLMADEMATNYIISQLNTVQANPFYITAGFYRPHKPFYVPTEYFDLYPINEIVLPETIEGDLLDGSTSMINNNANGNSGFFQHDVMEELSADSSDTKWWIKRHIQGYLACVSYVDEQVGKIMQALESSDYADNTYLIFSSDHGLHLGEKEYTKKNLLWSPSTQIPLIITGPNVPPNSIDNTPVSLIDLYPTFLDIATIEEPQQILDGFSLKGLIEDPGSGNWNGNDFVISAIGANDETPLFTFANSVNQHFSILNEEYRFNLLSSGERELYNLVEDPDEFVNLTDDPDYELIETNLKTELLSEINVNESDLLVVEDADVLFYGDFEQKINGWQSKVSNGSIANFEFDSIQEFNGIYSIVINVDSLLDTNPGNVQLINSCMIMEHNQLYELVFYARANENSNLKFLITLNGSPNYANLISNEFELSSEWSEYSFTFNYPSESTIFNSRIKFQFLNEAEYWLDDVKIKKIIDTGFMEINQDEKVIIYPNPVSNEFIFINSDHTWSKFELYTQMGQSISEGRIYNNRIFVPGEVSRGIYVLKLINDDGIFSKRIAIQ